MASATGIFRKYIATKASKEISEKQNSILPTLSKAQCLDYFRKFFSAIFLTKLFIFLHGFQAFQLHKLHSIWMPLHISKSLT